MQNRSTPGLARRSGSRRVVKWTIGADFPDPRSLRTMETQKVLCYVAMGVAGLVILIFLLDAVAGVLGRNIVLDVMFIIGGALVIWQGIETARELR
jgi:hypothetical protein